MPGHSFANSQRADAVVEGPLAISEQSHAKSPRPPRVMRDALGVLATWREFAPTGGSDARFLLYNRVYPIDIVAGFCLLQSPCRGPSCPVTGPFCSGRAVTSHSMSKVRLRRGDQPCGKPLSRQNRIAIEAGSLHGEQTVGRESLWQAGSWMASRFVPQSRQPVAAMVHGPGTATPSSKTDTPKP